MTEIFIRNFLGFLKCFEFYLEIIKEHIFVLHVVFIENFQV